MIRLKKNPNAKSKANMNPTNYWWATNEHLRSGIQSMYESDVSQLTWLDKNLMEFIDRMYQGNLSDKIAVLTITWLLCEFGDYANKG